jgi:hypothetical protein
MLNSLRSVCHIVRGRCGTINSFSSTTHLLTATSSLLYFEINLAADDGDVGSFLTHGFDRKGRGDSVSAFPLRNT